MSIKGGFILLVDQKTSDHGRLCSRQKLHDQTARHKKKPSLHGSLEAGRAWRRPRERNYLAGIKGSLSAALHLLLGRTPSKPVQPRTYQWISP